MGDNKYVPLIIKSDDADPIKYYSTSAAAKHGYIHNTDPQSMDHHLDRVDGPPSWTTFMDPPINK